MNSLGWFPNPTAAPLFMDDFEDQYNMPAMEDRPLRRRRVKNPGISRYKDGYDHRGGRENAVFVSCLGSLLYPLVMIPGDDVWWALDQDARDKIRRRGICGYCDRTLVLRGGVLLPRHKDKGGRNG